MTHFINASLWKALCLTTKWYGCDRTDACLWNFNCTSSNLHSYAIMAGDRWCFNFIGERVLDSTRESFTSVWSSDTYVCSLHCPPLHQGYSLEMGGRKKKTDWWHICPGVVIVKPYCTTWWQSLTKLMTLLSENIYKNNASIAAGDVLTPGWQACFKKWISISLLDKEQKAVALC